MVMRGKETLIGKIRFMILFQLNKKIIDLLNLYPVSTMWQTGVHTVVKWNKLLYVTKEQPKVI